MTGDIKIGNHKAWIDAYRQRADLNAELLAVLDDSSQYVEIMGSVSLGLQVETMFVEGADPSTLDPKALLERGNEAADVMSQAVAHMDRAAKVAGRVTAAESQVMFEEWGLGKELEEVAPADYVTRAIGEPSAVLSKRYPQVRAEIEIFRQLTGFAEFDQTLGTQTLKEPWAISAREYLVLNIQRIQLAQIMTSKDPTATAARFGKELVISYVGLPPKQTKSSGEELQIILQDNPELQAWFNEARKACAVIEPIAEGLSLDKPDYQEKT